MTVGRKDTTRKGENDMKAIKTVNTVKGFYNAIMNPVFWQDSSDAEYFVDDLGTGKYYIIRSTDGDKFYRLPGGKAYRNYITAYAALYVWAKSRNMIEVNIFEGGADYGRTQEAGRACHSFG